MKTDESRAIRLADYAPPTHLVESVELDIALHANATRVRARLALRPNPAAAAATLRLDGERLILVSLALDGKKLTADDYALDDRGLTLPGTPATPFVIDIETECDPAANKALSGLYQSGSLFCTQCEPEGFRRITYMLDRPDVLARYRVRLEADEAAVPVLLANGNPVAAGQLPGGRHFAEWNDPHPKPSYLFACVGGRLEHVEAKFTTRSDRVVTLRIYCEPGQTDRCGWAMESLIASMRWDEMRYGLEYDLDVFNIVAVSDFNMGAMENKGLNIFNDKLVLARGDTATDDDHEGIEGVIGHEYFHNWTGNRVTCRDWFQLCLKEGLTVYRDQEFTGDLRSPAVTRIENVQYLRAAQFAEDAGPLAHPVRPAQFVEINNFYTRTVYNKGAEICRMIEVMVGRQGFRAGLDLYFVRHDGTAATVEDFLAAMADANPSADLSDMMRWYEQAGTPDIAVSQSYDAVRRQLTLDFVQSQRATPDGVVKQPLPVPIRLGLVGPDGTAVPLGAQPSLSGDVFVMREAAASLVLDDVPAGTVPSLLRGFSAPVRLMMTQTDSALAHLLRNDSDPFGRWEAAQTLARRILVAAAQGKAAAEAEAAFIAALGACAGDDTLDPAFRALLLALPGEGEIARAIGADVDAAAVLAARRGLRQRIAQAHRTLFAMLMRRNRPVGPYSPLAPAVAARSLASVCLSYLATDPADPHATVAFAEAENMTETIAALAALAQHDTPAAASAFAAFHDRWRDDHLVIDKWFSLQASAPALATPQRIDALMAHPSFAMEVPNKVRAVLGAIAMANPSRFHALDGSGYSRLETAVLALDRFNPLMAARLTVPFEASRLYNAPAREAARATLTRIAETEGLSRDVRELVSKMLNA